MLQSTAVLEAFSIGAIGAIDGPIGKVKDFYFDDQDWAIPYFVVETGSWLSNRRVRVRPAGLGELNFSTQAIPAQLTREQVRSCPELNTHKPISRRQEDKLLAIDGHASGWGAEGLLESDMASGVFLPTRPLPTPPMQGPSVWSPGQAPDVPRQPSGDAHLRSCSAVSGHHVHATDGDIGHLEGALVDPRSWRIRFFIVNARNWWLGYRVPVAARLVSDIRWGDSKVSVHLSRDAIKGSHVDDESEPGAAEGDFGIYGGD